jgi:putative spermidine/putrescine transport system permease protein
MTEQGATSQPFHWLSAVSNGLAWFGYAFLVLPTLVILPMSFNGTDELIFPPANWSLRQYDTFFFKADWLSATFLSFKIAIVTAVLSVAIGVSAAYGLARGQFPGRGALVLFLLSPMLIPVIVVALGLYLYFSMLGLSGSMLPIIVGHTLVAIPFVIITASSALRHIEQNVETAAMIMGASPFQVFRKVTLPLLRSGIIASALFAFLISFDEVVIAYFIGKSGFSTLPVKMFSTIQWDISPVIAAVATLLTLFSTGICVLVSSLMDKK